MDPTHARISYFRMPLVFSLLLCFLSHTLCLELCNPYDKQILLQIKNQLGDPKSLRSWQPDGDCCRDYETTDYTYIHIDCDDQGHVVGLTISNAYDISGEIILPALGDLTYLESLTLMNVFNHPTEIPSQICSKFTKLRSLIITSSKLAGSIPDCLGQLKNLQKLDLSWNGLTGPIPSSISQLSNLQILEIFSNKLNGTLPEFPTTMDGLSRINLYDNNLSGRIPWSLGLLSNLSTLRLGSNHFHGSIPASIGRIAMLTWLDVSSNQLTGPIPKSFGLLPENGCISLANNRLTGPLPKSMSSINPWLLDLSGNELTGDASFFFASNKSWLQIIDTSLKPVRCTG